MDQLTAFSTAKVVWMAKVKAPKGANIPNKAIYSRVSYLYQAAAYLATQSEQPATSGGQKIEESVAIQALGPNFAIQVPTSDTVHVPSSLSQYIPRQLLSDLRAVSLKTQIRLSPAIKHSICKCCNSFLVDGSTCTQEIENRSKNGKKPWADVLIRKCKNCGYERRFPVAHDRQTRRISRAFKSQPPNDKWDSTALLVSVYT